MRQTGRRGDVSWYILAASGGAKMEFPVRLAFDPQAVGVEQVALALRLTPVMISKVRL